MATSGESRKEWVRAMRCTLDRPQTDARLWPFYSEEAVERVATRVRGGDLSAVGEDPDVNRCEELVAAILAPGSRVLLCNSGTAALASAYAALRLERGAEVLVPSHTFRATVTPLLAAGYRPVLCDTDPRTGNIDLADARARISTRTQALVVTHMWGRPVPLSAARALADTHGLALVEDCSHAHGARCDSSQVGTTGDAAVFSLGTTKLVSGGLAGALVTRDNVLYERAVTFGQPKHRVLARVSDAALRDLALTGAGHNLRCSPVAAILAADHLERLPETVRIKNGNLARLRAAMQALLPSLVPLPASDQPSAGTLYKFHARWRGPDVTAQETRDLLATAGTRARRPAAALHTLPLFTDPDVLAALYPQAPNPARTHAGDYPRTDDFLADLIEFDTRDLYHESPVIAHHYERALDLAASKLRGGGC